MSYLERVRHATRRAALFLSLSLAACDGPTRPVATEPLDSPAAVGAPTARAIALAMAEAPVRQQILTDLRNSPYSEHKVVFQDYLRSPGGRVVLAAIERAGIDSDSLNTALQRIPRIQFYVPVTTQRSSWRGTPDVFVVPNLAREAPAAAFTPSGGEEVLHLAQGLPTDVGAIFVLEWAEPMFRRWAGPTAARETIQRDGESQVGSGRVTRDATGRFLEMTDDTPEGGREPYRSPAGESVSAGTYLSWLYNYGVCDNFFCDDLELQFYAISPGGEYGAELLSGISQYETWTGLWKVHDIRATPSTPIEIELWETDASSGDDYFFCGIGIGPGPCSGAHHPFLDGSYWDQFTLCQTDPCQNLQGPNLQPRFVDRAPPVVASVTVAPATASLYEYGTLVGITATPLDQYGQVIPGKAATWTSSNSSIATVASTGSLTADVHGVAAGGATITATIDGVGGTASVTVLRQRFARPDSDVENPGLWSPTPSNWPLWQTLNEAGTPNDNSAVSKTLAGGETKSFTVGLSNILDPQTSTGHTIRARVRHSQAGGIGTFTVELMQGAVVKATFVQYDLANTFTTYTYTLTPGEADGITDYSDLRLRVTSRLYTGPVTVDVSWLEFEVP